MGDEFLESIRAFAAVFRNVAETHPLRSEIDAEKAIASRLRAHLDGVAVERYIQRFSEYGGILLNAGTGRQCGKKRAFPGCLSAEKDETVVYVELLASVWLALYFLGVPDGRLWDVVLRWTEERGGGLPNGICVAKAIGDLVRSTRKAHEARRGFQGWQPKPLRVHSYLPLMIFPQLIDKPVLQESKWGDEAASAMSLLHVMGRVYEFMQLRLYAYGAHPFVYSVPKRLVVDNLKNDRGEVTEDAYNAMLSNLVERVGLSVSGAEPSTQRIVVVDADSPPACFVNERIGLFTFEDSDPHAASDDIPLPASYMRDDRRYRYYERLERIVSKEEWRNLLSQDEGCKQKLLAHLSSPGASPNSMGDAASTHPHSRLGGDND
jgi:hypothetical protein